MSSDEKPLWKKIALSAIASFGLLCAIVDAGVLVATIRHHTAEYHEALSLVSNDLEREYEESARDAAKMTLIMKEDTETRGTDNLFLLLTTPEGEVVSAASSSKSVLEQMRARAQSERPSTYRIVRQCRNHREDAIRVRKTRLADGNILSVGYNVTNAEQHVILEASLLAASLVVALFVGAALGIGISRRFAAPLSRMAAAARRLAGGDYSSRVSVSGEGGEITELENAFNHMAAENEKIISDLRTLTDDLAHDLRTPLTRLRAAAEIEMLNAGSVPPPLAATVSEETASMLELINTMLDISRTGNLPERTPREEINLCAFARNVVELYSVLAEESGIQLSLALPPESVYFTAHKVRMQQILGNLLDNAVKFTPRGGKVELSLSPNPVTIVVANTGEGIRPDELPHIFKRFWRAEKSRSLPGNGLGLALVKAIVSSYGGTVRCESNPGEKTVFTVVFDSEDASAGRSGLSRPD
ncbi:MAG: HAMP domain-containing histidine kinase [Kiritimatiellae bacterium]|nr:HAMP domain-containing histidine kinase [Kiritimatiellia bacterium]